MNPYESPDEAEPLPQSSRDYTGCLIWMAVAAFALLVLWLIAPAIVFAKE